MRHAAWTAWFRSRRADSNAALRLHGVVEQAEARAQVQLAILDDLIRDADREISRLQTQLTRSRLGPAVPDIERRAA